MTKKTKKKIIKIVAIIIFYIGMFWCIPVAMHTPYSLSIWQGVLLVHGLWAGYGIIMYGAYRLQKWWNS